MIEHNGYKLNIERHIYNGELEETYFDVSMPNGFTTHLDWSGWGLEPTQADFALWLALDMPTRDHDALKEQNSKVSTPLNTNDLLIIKQYKGL